MNDPIIAQAVLIFAFIVGSFFALAFVAFTVRAFIELVKIGLNSQVKSREHA